MRLATKVPPLGSFKDRYLREILNQERDLEVKRLSLGLILNRGKSQEAAGDNRAAMGIFKEIINLLFPNAPIANKEEDKKSVSAVERWLKKNKGRRLLDDEGPVTERASQAVTPQRRSLWDAMQGGANEGERGQ